MPVQSNLAVHRREGAKFICYLPPLISMDISLAQVGTEKNKKIVAVATRKGALTPCMVFKGGEWVNI